MTPLSGVRNSWLILARNSLLARVAASADSFASRSSSSCCRRARDVAHERAEEAPAGAHWCRDGDLDWKLVTVAMETAQLEPPVDDRRLAGLVETTHPFDVRRPETVGMIVSDSCRPITSSRVQPNVAAAWAFHETMPIGGPCR